MVYELFNVLLDSVSYNFVEDFCICIHHDIDLSFSFFVLFFPGFCIRAIVASQNEFGSVPSSSIFLEVSEN